MLTKSEKERVALLINLLSYQYGSTGATTMSKCKTVKCTESARGGGHCPNCLELKLRRLIGRNAAFRIHFAYSRWYGARVALQGNNNE